MRKSSCWELFSQFSVHNYRATTHTDLLLRAKKRNIQTHVVHNASIMNAAGACGLQVRFRQF